MEPTSAPTDGSDPRLKRAEPTEARASGAALPSISLPKGGGAIRGIGEKFGVNPVNGTGSMTVPIATSPGRSGFGPSLALSYDSGAGNGPFGLGWTLSLPSISRKTDKGLPRYVDDGEEADVFLLSGAEDLVPLLTKTDGEWKRDKRPPRIVDGRTYDVQRYRPRVEGLFARIERWTNRADRSETFWRSISKDNITTWYGKTADSRIADPADPTRIFSWLICESHDDRGNAMVYGYAPENDENVDQGQAHERNRVRTANRYLQRIRYGNHAPYFPRLEAAAPWPTPPGGDQWLFEVVFDYGDHDRVNPRATEARDWPVRPDPFSSYRPGFEVRTYRLCQRVLMFHHFPGESEVGSDCLVCSTDLTYSRQNAAARTPGPLLSTLLSVTQTSYKRKDANSYLSRTLPPLELAYSEARLQPELRELDRESVKNLPAGLADTRNHWVDLDGEGLAGMLTEQAGAWFYKRNLSPLNLVARNGSRQVEAQLGPLEQVAARPAFSLAQGAQFLDLAGDGRPDLVQIGGPVAGFWERTVEGGWESFVPFQALPVLDWSDPNLRFIDLDGDGHTDILISEDGSFTWHQSLGEAGFTIGGRVPQPRDEERGPHLVFADSTQSIYVADMSGDGLGDLVRIRNGEVAYWPNLGYGRFGAKVTMDNAPWFDTPDRFDQRRIRLGDIDGSGTTDILYLCRDGVRVYFNQSGNGWSAPTVIEQAPAIDSVMGTQVLDLLGNGTACIVWASPLPGDERRPLRYIDLMGGQKPHLLVNVKNNLGAETSVQYAPSTRFYLQDRLDGRPWVTKLPFPVHCVEKISVTDRWRQTVFSTTYSYHHGYFDGPEREFRGFGRVDQVDVESFGQFLKGNSASPYITADKTLYQPPVKTVTWYHTGALLDRERILTQFEHEYFPRWLEDLRPDEPNILGGFQENILPEPDLAAADLSADEWREALRSCKGMMLRQEVYELDVDALEHGEHRPVKLFSTAYHNCHIRRLQPKADNPHAVFLVAESEAVTYHYELDLRPTFLRPDPRIAHTLKLSFDEYGNVLQSVAVAYPRLAQLEVGGLPPEALARIRGAQQETHLGYVETRYTDDFVQQDDSHRLRVPCEVVTYELTGVSPEDEDDRASPDVRDNRYFGLEELRRFRLSAFYQPEQGLTPVPEIGYHQLPKRTVPEKRLVEHTRTLFFKDDGPTLAAPLPFRQLGRLGLPYESYRLALTEDLLGAVFGAKLPPEVRDRLSDAAASGYLSGAPLAAAFPGIDTGGQLWIRSGIAGFTADAAQHFYLLDRYTDPFGNVSRVEYDPRALYVSATTDPLGNTTRVTRFDFRLLAPREIKDVNDNLAEMFFDVLGLPCAMAVKGKGQEGDDLDGFDDVLANPAPGELAAFFNAATYNETQARRWLGNATARHVYSLGETRGPDGVINWGAHPACACSIVRERHVSQLAPAELSPLQTTFEYSDGLGSVLVKKAQAEPEAADQPLRWVASGKVVLNNKGKPVKQYEPYFSPSLHRYEEPQEEGVTPVIYYDAAGRTVRTELPDGSYSRVELSPWQVTTYDLNDTVTEPGNVWFARKTAASAAPEDKRAAALAAEHGDTPSLVILDSLGREVASIAHNRTSSQAGALTDEKYVSFIRLDAEGKPLWIRDARNNLVMQYIVPPVPNYQAADPASGFSPCYDIAGNLLFQHGMDAGDRWILNDVAGKPMLAWNDRGFFFRTTYDELHRPAASFVTGADPQDPHRSIQFESIVYGDTPTNGLSEGERAQLNLRGRPYKQHDAGGIVVNSGRNPATGADEAFDFKGNLLRSTLQLARQYRAPPDWSQNVALESETFTSATRYDALNRPIQQVAAHSSRPGASFSVIQPSYNEAGLLERVNVWLEQATEPSTLLAAQTASQHAVTNIDYNAKGQRLLVEYCEGAGRVATQYSYDPETFRLVRLVTTRPNHPDAGKRTLQDLSYTYDPSGNITQIQDRAQDRVFHGGACVDPGAEYRYDPLYRLIAATGREHKGGDQQPDWDDVVRGGTTIPNDCTALRRYVETYRYDAVDNILQMRHHEGGNLDQPGSVVWNRRYQYALDSNRLLATSRPGDPDNLPSYTAAPGYGARYGHDLHGAMTGMPHLPAMEWDFKDQLRATQRQVVNNGTGEKTHYVYTASGQRLRKVTERPNGQRREERIYLSGFEVYRRYDGDGQTVTLERETLHVHDDKQRVALIETRTRLTGNDPAPRQLVRYQHGNHLGSSTVEVDEQAAVISYEEYHPYGTTAYQAARSQTEAPKRYRYTGKERDEETGLYYNGARYYSPWLGRWTACDPAGLNDSACAYAYVRNNPVRYHDPTGAMGEAAAEIIPAAVESGVRLIPAAVAGARAGAPVAGTAGAAYLVAPPPAKVALIGAGVLLAVGVGLALINRAYSSPSKPTENNTPAPATTSPPPPPPPAPPSQPRAGVKAPKAPDQHPGSAPPPPEPPSQVGQWVPQVPKSTQESPGKAQASGGGGKTPPDDKATTLPPGSSLPTDPKAFSKLFSASDGKLLNQLAKEVAEQIKGWGGPKNIVVGVSAGVIAGRVRYVVTVSEPGSWHRLDEHRGELRAGLEVGPPPKMVRDGKDWILDPMRHVEVEGPLWLKEQGASGVVVGTSSPACKYNCQPQWKQENPKKYPTPDDVWHTNVPLEEKKK